MLDHLAKAVRYVPPRYAGTAYGNAEAYFIDYMNETDRLAFDCFLVRTKDPLGYEPGSPKHRFASRVARMRELMEGAK